MKKLAIILAASLLYSCGHDNTVYTNTEIELEVVYTNGDIDTLSGTWKSGIDDKPYCYISTSGGSACVLITSRNEYGANTLACGIRKFKELSRQSK